MTQAYVFSAAFLLAYCYVAFGSKLRGVAVWVAAALAMAVCALAGLPIDIAALSLSVDINILLIFSGILLVAEVLMETGMPAWLAARLVAVSKSLGVASLLLCLLSGAVSMFVENVATVMLIAPVALELCRRMEASPVPLLICMAVSSNLQGTATLVGDPPSMILASSMGLTFNDFFVYMGRPGIFFAVQAGALASAMVLWGIFRRDRRRVAWDAIPSVTSWVPSIILAGVIAGLVAASFLGPDAGVLSGAVCGAGGALALVWHSLSHRGNLPTVLRVRPRDPLEGRSRGSKEIIRGFDLDTLALLAGIFFMVGALERYGVMESVGSFVARVSGNSPFTAFLLIIWGSVAVSAFVDNVPYVTAMIPVAEAVSRSLGLGANPVLMFGLLIGACIGGNISPVGASANIIAVSMLRKAGFRAGFGEFVRIGLPFTVVATAAGSIFLWGVWSP